MYVCMYVSIPNIKPKNKSVRINKSTYYRMPLAKLWYMEAQKYMYTGARA